MDINCSSRKQIVFGTILSYIAMGLQMITSVITTPFIVRVLGDSSYGVYKVIASFVAYLTVLNFGFGTAGIRYISEYRITSNKIKETQLLSFIHSLNYITSFIIFLLGMFLYSVIPMLFGNSMSEDEIKLAQKLFAILIVNIIVSVFTDKYSGIINAYERFAFIKIIDVIRSVSKIILVFAILQVSPNAISLTVIDLLLSICVLFAEYYYCHKKICVNTGKLTFKYALFKEYKDFLLYAAGIFITMIINQLLWNVDSVIIGMRLGSVDSAIYAIGTTFSSTFFSASIIITNMLLPRAVRMVESGADKNEYTNFSVKIARIQGYIIFYMFIGFAVYGKTFIKLWVGDQYYGAWTTSILVMGGTLFSSFVISVQVILRALKRQKVYNFVHLCIFALNAILTYFAVGKFGINGAAMMTFLTYLVGYIFIIYPYYHNCIGVNIFRIFKGLILWIIPTACVVGFIAYMVHKIILTSWLSLFVEVCVYSVIYFVCMYVVMNKDEQSIIRSFVLKLKRK